ncbi:Imidazole glycerol phosphate synthase amidotransferase subunit [Candidatus Vidania fulgoroideae]|nr:Imidazole glycerol phosphate synthase amidotransferase subunit [Candidatus Vidania fulgoroideae]
MIGILNIGFGNIKSVKNCISISRQKKEKIIYIENKKDIKDCRRIVIPGHGFFKNVINKLKKIEMINSILDLKKKTLGICIGLQMFGLFNSEGNTNGFGLISENVENFENKKEREVPNMGWREVEIIKKNRFIKKNLSFYFAHSYFIRPCSETFGITKGMNFFSSFIIKKNIVLTQFHPEKSGSNGINFIKNFLK